MTDKQDWHCHWCVCHNNHHSFRFVPDTKFAGFIVLEVIVPQFLRLDFTFRFINEENINAIDRNNT